MSLHLNLGFEDALATIVSGLGEVRIGYAIAITIWPAGVAAIFSEIVNRLWRQIVAQPVASIDRDPEGIGLWIDCQSDRISQPFCEDLHAAAIGIEFHHGRSPRIFFNADIATRSCGDIHLAAMK